MSKIMRKLLQPSALNVLDSWVTRDLGHDSWMRRCDELKKDDRSREELRQAVAILTPLPPTIKADSPDEQVDALLLLHDLQGRFGNKYRLSEIVKRCVGISEGGGIVDWDHMDQDIGRLISKAMDLWNGRREVAQFNQLAEALNNEETSPEEIITTFTTMTTLKDSLGLRDDSCGGMFDEVTKNYGDLVIKDIIKLSKALLKLPVTNLPGMAKYYEALRSLERLNGSIPTDTLVLFRQATQAYLKVLRESQDRMRLKRSTAPPTRSKSTKMWTLEKFDDKYPVINEPPNASTGPPHLPSPTSSPPPSSRRSIPLGNERPNASTYPPLPSPTSSPPCQRSIPPGFARSSPNPGSLSGSPLSGSPLSGSPLSGSSPASSPASSPSSSRFQQLVEQQNINNLMTVKDRVTHRRQFIYRDD